MALDDLVSKIKNALSPESFRRATSNLNIGRVNNLVYSERSRQTLLWVFSIVFGLLAVLFAHEWRASQVRQLEKQRAELMANYKAPIPVVVASRELGKGATVEASMLTTIQVPEKFVQPYALRSSEQVIGLVTLAPVAAGEQILRNKLRTVEEIPRDATMSGLTPVGKRAVTIATDAMSGVGGFIRPGDKVDILWTVKMPDGDPTSGDQAATLTLFQGIQVLAVGGDMSGTRTSPAATSSSGRGDSVVTLAMSPRDAAFLLFAREQGRIQLTLRPRLEGGEQNIPPANLSTLMQLQFGVPGEEPPRPPRRIEVYKGLERKIITLGDQTR